MEVLPKSIGTGEFELFGVTLKCHVLSDGQRVIEQDSFIALLEAMSTTTASHDEIDAVLEKFARWMRGV